MGDNDKPQKWRKFIAPIIDRKELYKQVKIAEDVTTRHARRFIFRRLDSMREVRRHIVLWIIAVGVLIGATGVQLMWYQQGYRTQAFTSDGIYAEAVLGPLSNLNPLFASSSAEQSVSRLIFSSLFTYDKKGHLSGDLATSMKIDKKGTTYTIKLRTDALWQDGFRVTAKDVAFTVGLLKDPSLRSTNPEDWSHIDVRVIDDETIVFKLPAVIAAFSNALTFPVLPRHILSTIEAGAIRENDFSNNPVGSGVFKLKLLQDVDNSLGHKVVYLERNADYYKGPSKLERFQLHVYDSQEAIVKGLTSGEVNAAADLSSANISGLNRDRYEIKSMPIKSGVYALLNTTDGVLSDKKVRQALQAGTDTASIRQQLEGDKPALHLPLVGGQVSGKVPAAPKYNVSVAKKLLDEAGWKLNKGVRKKSGKTMQLTVASTKDSNYERNLENVVGQWRDLGITVNTLILDLADTTQRTSQEIIQSRNYDVMLYQLTIGADPDVYAYWHSSQTGFGGLNLSNYSNDIADDALVSARSRLEPDLRNAKYLTFVRQWLSDVPAIGLYQSTVYYVYSKKDKAFDDKNVFVSPLDRYADVRYWAVNSSNLYKTP